MIYHFQIFQQCIKFFIHKLPPLTDLVNIQYEHIPIDRLTEDLTLLLFTLKIDRNIGVTVEKRPKKEMVIDAAFEIARNGGME